MAFASGVAAAGGRSEIIAGPVAASASDPAFATAAIRYKANGEYETVVGVFPLPEGNWVKPAGAAAEWEIRATLNSGPLPTGTFNAWLPMTADRTWSLTRSSTGIFLSTMTFEFRRVGDTDPEVTIGGNSIQVIVEIGGE